jgi:hypothetical protein
MTFQEQIKLIEEAPLSSMIAVAYSLAQNEIDRHEAALKEPMRDIMGDADHQGTIDIHRAYQKRLLEFKFK